VTPRERRMARAFADVAGAEHERAQAIAPLGAPDRLAFSLFFGLLNARAWRVRGGRAQ